MESVWYITEKTTIDFFFQFDDIQVIDILNSFEKSLHHANYMLRK